MNKQKQMLISSAIVYKGIGKSTRWLLVKEEKNEDWCFPTANVRTAESSVRTAIRIMGDKGGMRIKILAEAGRSGGVAKIGERVVPARHLYYLAYVKNPSPEQVGFLETVWLPYAKVARKLLAKKDREMIKSARQWMEKLKKEGKLKGLNEISEEEQV